MFSKTTPFLPLFLLLLLPPTLCITLPLHSNSPRCMMIFSFGSNDIIKLQLKLPKIPNRHPQQHYEMKYRNTQTQQTHLDSKLEGVYRHEFTVDAFIIYEVCITLRTERELGMMKVEYSAHTEFIINHEQVRLPENLLKSKDIENTYYNAVDIGVVGQKFEEVQEKRADKEESLFESTASTGLTLLSLCRMELAIIVGTALYQLLAVRKYLLQNHFV